MIAGGIFTLALLGQVGPVGMQTDLGSHALDQLPAVVRQVSKPAPRPARSSPEITSSQRQAIAEAKAAEASAGKAERKRLVLIRAQARGYSRRYRIQTRPPRSRYQVSPDRVSRAYSQHMQAVGRVYGGGGSPTRPGC